MWFTVWLVTKYGVWHMDIGSGCSCKLSHLLNGSGIPLGLLSNGSCVPSVGCLFYFLPWPPVLLYPEFSKNILMKKHPTILILSHISIKYSQPAGLKVLTASWNQPGFTALTFDFSGLIYTMYFSADVLIKFIMFQIILTFPKRG